MQRVAINGLGRIGRATFKILMEDQNLQLVAISDTIPAYQLAYLLNFDTIYGKLENRVAHDDYNLYVNGKQIRVINVQDLSHLPWGEMGVDVVFECSGKYTRKEDLEKHLHAGAKHVILSAPSTSDDVTTVVNGVNRPEEENDLRIISCASSTANCIAPIVEIMGRRLGVKKSMMTAINAYTSNQSIVDSPSTDLRKGRSGSSNFIPVPTSAAIATTKVLPQYRNKFSGISVRGPVAVGSLADITFVTERPTSVEEVNYIFQQEAGSERYMGIVAVNFDPIVSTDVLKDSRASVIDLSLTQVVDGDLVKVMSWYDSEYGFANQMIREAKRIAKLEPVLVQY
jgi:glyceraldehyde 3-phosphate dehydrogenase